MRTKALILAGLMSAAGVASSIAQNVYSVNVVGYINVSLTNRFSLVANQLDNGLGNYVTNLFAGAPPNTRVYKLTPTGSYDILTYRGAPFNRWDPVALAASMTLSSGEGAFVLNPNAPTPINFTFVGEVLEGTLINPVATGFDIYSAMVPQEGGIQTVHGYVPNANDRVYKYLAATGTYDIRTYRGAPFNRWDPISPGEPVLGVAEAVFISTGTAKNWTRIFDVQ